MVLNCPLHFGWTNSVVVYAEHHGCFSVNVSCVRGENMCFLCIVTSCMHLRLHT